MKQEELLKEISQTLNKQKIVKLAAIAAESNGCIAALLEFSFYPKSQIAFRASWILEHVAENNPGAILEFFSDFIRVYPAQNNQSCRRHFTKILMNRRLRYQIGGYPDQLVEPLVDATFRWLIDPDTPVAVKVNCIDILYTLSEKYEWVGEELAAQVEVLLKDGSAAMQSRGKKILEKLRGKS